MSLSGNLESRNQSALGAVEQNNSIFFKRKHFELFLFLLAEEEITEDFGPNYLNLFFLSQNHIQYVQFWQLEQKLWQFEVLPKPDLADFCILRVA